MTIHKEALTHLKAITEAFGPDEGIELDQKAWSKLHSAIKEALAKLDKIAALQQKTESHDVDCLCSDCAALDDLDEALAQPEQEPDEVDIRSRLYQRIHELETQLAQPEQEPVAWITQGGKGWLRWHKSYDDNKDSVPLYTTPPQRKPSKEDALYETFAKIAAYLEIDTEAARSAAGKPSDVFIEAIKKREAPQRKPLTDEMVLAGARALAKRHADSCGLDFDDVWKYYADEHKDDAKVVIEAAHGIKE